MIYGIVRYTRFRFIQLHDEKKVRDQFVLALYVGLSFLHTCIIFFNDLFWATIGKEKPEKKFQYCTILERVVK